jgi:hypothetical protein
MHFNPAGRRRSAPERISSGQWERPSFEMAMARKDLRQLV